MPKAITIDLIRRKAEHNEGLIHTLEELSLHQEELESIDETLGCNCRRLKILYLQNNIIGEMKNLHHMKELEYLNLALNNISKVEGLQSCEFLNKLDLTVNFVDLDELESSVSAMEGNKHLRDLYMMGNPCQSWPGFEAYVIARLPQLERLDGKEITRTGRIKAQQRLPALREEIMSLAEEVRRRKLAERQAAKRVCEDKENTDDGKSSASRGGAGHPPAPGKGDDTTLSSASTAAAATAAAVERARKREAEGVIRQCNEGKLEFRFEETRGVACSSHGEGGRGAGRGRGGMIGGSSSGSNGDIVLEVAVPKYLDSSLIDLDVHPHYVSIVIKGKVLRLSLQAEVKAGEAKARRSKTTGSLVVTMPKVDPDQSIGLIPSDGRRRAPGIMADRAAASKNAARNDVGRTRRRGGGTPPLAALMMEEAQAAAAAAKKSGDGSAAAEAPLQAVSIRGIVGPRHGGLAVEATPQMSEVSSTVRRVGSNGSGNGNGIGDGNGIGNDDSQSLPQPPPHSGIEGADEAACLWGVPRLKQQQQSGKQLVPPAPPSGDSVS